MIAINWSNHWRREVSKNKIRKATLAYFIHGPSNSDYSHPRRLAHIISLNTMNTLQLTRDLFESNFKVLYYCKFTVRIVRSFSMPVAQFPFLLASLLASRKSAAVGQVPYTLPNPITGNEREWKFH